MSIARKWTFYKPKKQMKQSMNEKDDRIEGFGEDMKIRETELVEVYWKD